MPDRRKHWVLLVGPALLGAAAWMGVHIGEYAKLPLFAMSPERGVTSRVERDGARLVGGGIEIVVADEGGNAGEIPVLWAEQESAALPLPRTAAAQLEDRPPPKGERDPDRTVSAIHQGSLRRSAVREILRGNRQSCDSPSRRGAAGLLPIAGALEPPPGRKDGKRPFRCSSRSGRSWQ